jgi:hypothetical protein
MACDSNHSAWGFAIQRSADWRTMPRVHCRAVKRKFARGRPIKRNDHEKNKKEVGDRDLGNPSIAERGNMDFAQHCGGTMAAAFSSGTDQTSIRAPTVAAMAAAGTDETNVRSSAVAPVATTGEATSNLAKIVLSVVFS